MRCLYQANERGCICVRLLTLSTIVLWTFGTVLTVSYFSIRFLNCSNSVLFFYGILELFWECVIFWFSLFYYYSIKWLLMIILVVAHCVVCSSSIYVSDFPFGIFKLFLYVSHLSKVFGNVKKSLYNQPKPYFFKKLLWSHFWTDVNKCCTKTFGIVNILIVYLLIMLLWVIFICT